MKLRLGKMTNEELANWFGIVGKTFTNNRKKYFKELESFAKFEIVRGGVEIKEILVDTYNRKMGSNARKIKEIIPEIWKEGVPDTSKRVSKVIRERLQLPLAEDTYYVYTNNSKIELYGKPFMNDGEIGSCYSVWCKTEGEGVDQKISYFTPEENAIKNKLLKKYFGDANERELLIEEMINTGEIKKEEAWDVIREMSGLNKNSFGLFKAELESQIGYKTIRATVLNNRRTEALEDFSK